MRQRHADDKNGSWFEGSASSMEVFLQQLINGLTLGSIYGLIAIGYTMVFGIIGMVNFAHGDIFMLSAFIALIFFMLVTAILGTSAGMVMLALIIELLACALTGSHFGFETESFFVDEGGPARLGQAFMAIDPGALAGNEAYLERVETLVEAMLEDDGVRLPGDRRRKLRDEALKHGVEVPEALMTQLRAMSGVA